MPIQVTPIAKMKRKRGGQKKHWAEIARIQMWYGQVKQRGWPDYRLNQEFAWADADQPRTTDTRPRIFEWIRKKSRAPEGRDQRWRSMLELVAAVDRHPEFQGTKIVFEAEMWDLLQEANPAADVVQSRIDRILASNKLVRLPMDKIGLDGNSLVIKLGERLFYHGCLRLTLSRINRFEQIALCWLLYLQTESPHHAIMREVLLEMLDGLLDIFCCEFFRSSYDLYYERSLDALLATKLNLMPRPMTAYRQLEIAGECAIIPEKFTGVVTLEHFIEEKWSVVSP